MQLSLPELCSVHGLNVTDTTAWYSSFLAAQHKHVGSLWCCVRIWLSLSGLVSVFLQLMASGSQSGCFCWELQITHTHTHTNQPISLHMCICVCVCITERGTSCQDNGNSQIPHITFCRDKGLHSFQVFTNIAKENSVTANKQWVSLPSSIRFVDRRIQYVFFYIKGCQSLHISIWI